MPPPWEFCPKQNKTEARNLYSFSLRAQREIEVEKFFLEDHFLYFGQF
jgi:hypothetical protein